MPVAAVAAQHDETSLAARRLSHGRELGADQFHRQNAVS